MLMLFHGAQNGVIIKIKCPSNLKSGSGSLSSSTSLDKILKKIVGAVREIRLMKVLLYILFEKLQLKVHSLNSHK